MFRRDFVLDLETIPDSQVGEFGPTEFPPPIAHRIVCASLLTVEHDLFEGTPFRFGLSSWTAADYSESEIIRAIDHRLGDPKALEARVIGFNTRCFDLPVLFARSLATLCPATPNIAAFHALARHDERHLDLIEHLGARSGRTGTLEQSCRLVGIPVKTNIHGSDVAGLAAAGEHAAIRSYCEEDVLATWLLARHVDKARADISPAALWVSWARLSSWIDKGGDTRAHLAAFKAHPLIGRMAPILAREAQAAGIDLNMPVEEVAPQDDA